MAVMDAATQLFLKLVGNGNESGRMHGVHDHFSENGWRP
jgi:hypothetical protein